MEILIAFLWYYLVGWIASIAVNFRDYKFFKKGYQELPKQEFISSETYVVNQDWSFYWNKETNSFKIFNEYWVLGGPIKYFDPYTFYWNRKYLKWFKENVK